MTSNPATSYLERVITRAEERQVPWPTWLSERHALCVYYQGFVQWLTDPETLIAMVQSEMCSGRAGVCVVENIHPNWIEVLGTEWHIDLDFFVNHAYNPPKATAWDPSWDSDRIDLGGTSPTTHYRRHYSLMGTLEQSNLRIGSEERFTRQSRNFFPRPRPWTPEGLDYADGSRTKVSYVRVNSLLCM